MNRDQNDIAPEVTLGSAVIRIPEAFLETARSWRAGTLDGRPLYAGADDGVVDFVPNPAVGDRVPPDLRERIRQAAVVLVLVVAVARLRAVGLDDLRTGVETGNIQAVMDGALDPFINAWLRAGGPTSRNKNVSAED